MIFSMMDGYRRMARRYPVPFICTNIILVVLWINVILWFSSENADASGGRSARILVSIVNMVAPSADITLDNYNSIEALDNCEKVIRKAAHMFEYAILSILTWSVLFGSVRIPRRFAYIIPILIACITGSIDENHQTLVEGRYGSPVDVCIDMLGALIAVAVAYRLTCFYRDRVRKMNSHHDA